MRLPVIILTLLIMNATSAFCITDANFDKFIKSREVVATLYFGHNDKGLGADEREQLLEKISELKALQRNGRMIRVEGFSSLDGDREKNFILSFFRARSVARLIQSKGLPAEVTLTGYGDLKAKSADPVRERRVEIASYSKPTGMRRVKIAEAEHGIMPESAQNDADGANRVFEIDSYSVEQAIRSKLDSKGLAEQESDNLKKTPRLSHTEESKRIGPYRIDRAIRSKVDDNDLAGEKDFEIQTDTGWSQSYEEIERGYTLWRKSIDPDFKQKVAMVSAADEDLKRGYSQTKPAADEDLKRGYSQAKPAADEDLKRGYSQAIPAEGEDIERGYSQWQTVLDPETSPGVTQVMPAQPPLIDALMIEQAIMEKIGVATVEPSGAVSQISMDFSPANPSN